MKRSLCLKLAVSVAVLLSGPIAHAIAPEEGADRAAKPLLTRSFDAPELAVAPTLETVTAQSRAAPLAAFERSAGGSWEARWDRRSNRPNLIQGSGWPLVPGSANTLRGSGDVDLDHVARALSNFMEKQSALLGLDGIELVLDREASTGYGHGNTHWFVEFAQFHRGVRVAGANVFFRLSHGNIVQFGTEKVASIGVDVTPALSRDKAFALALAELDLPSGTTVAEVLEPGELELLPAATEARSNGEPYAGKAGAGYTHRLAWRFGFRVAGRDETLDVLFDARANRVLAVDNLTVQATVTGGVYPQTNTDPETIVALPYVAVTNGTAKTTDANGVYTYGSGTATTSLDGKYFRMTDSCGSISLSSGSPGNLALGSSGGTNCTTPGVGGAGNTHASRTGFYHLTRINQKARGILTTNTWLQGKVTANMNVNNTCNASWNGSSMSFYRSGGGCSNTGEIAAVFLHEWGHGMDQNSGGAASDKGTGEAVGDTFAFLETKNSCIGPNFQPGVLCANCTTCTGVRDVKDFSLAGTRTIARPSNVTSNTGINCDARIGQGGVACPYIHPTAGVAYQGPMGYQGHCESLIASSANWDLAQALVARHGTTAGWAQMDKIWYASLTPSKSAYRVASGGKCNTAATVDGCGSNNWYTVFLAADDNDGNLANGTPNACRIWDAYNAHGIACGTRPTCTL
jgi:hypothetical protein